MGVVTESHVAELELHLASENKECSTQLDERLRQKLLWTVKDQMTRFPTHLFGDYLALLDEIYKGLEKCLEEKSHTGTFYVVAWKK
jgi:hypothetical protein